MAKEKGLTSLQCVPCEGGVPAMSRAKADELLQEVNSGPLSGGNPWHIAEHGKTLVKQFRFKDFAAARQAVNAMADVADGEGHHPDIEWVFSTVTLDLWTHAADGLTENDFILAAKIEAALKEHDL
jgi:4a-hydroxytetrahydrobiopterin dehydratase